ncbi:hypothetical protein MtrunA17_Chr1g0196601 [Medicago truncatula]|uniref:Transmembrane protein n=1 Tax=Medicago truncatula TaxID=3880 RepID=A0A396JWN3_MEDTR|nr:hypothetical protein MtrunA17_Chr1g0196601 [Medicago truncatula]
MLLRTNLTKEIGRELYRYVTLVDPACNQFEYYAYTYLRSSLLVALMEPFLVFGGITCFAAAAAYVSARTSDKDAEILKSVTRVNQLKDLGMYVSFLRDSNFLYYY